MQFSDVLHFMRKIMNPRNETKWFNFYINNIFLVSGVLRFEFSWIKLFVNYFLKNRVKNS